MIKTLTRINKICIFFYYAIVTPLLNKIVDILIMYIQQSNTLSVNSSVLSGMKDLQRQIRKKQVDSLKQASLQDYFTITM